MIPLIYLLGVILTVVGGTIYSGYYASQFTLSNKYQKIRMIFADGEKQCPSSTSVGEFWSVFVLRHIAVTVLVALSWPAISIASIASIGWLLGKRKQRKVTTAIEKLEEIERLNALAYEQGLMDWYVPSDKRDAFRLAMKELKTLDKNGTYNYEVKNYNDPTSDYHRQVIARSLRAAGGRVELAKALK